MKTSNDNAAVSQLAGEIAPRKKCSYIGAPAVFALEQCCQQINDAFDGFGCYVVGSSMERPDWRDVDVRYIMSDEDFSAMFPNCTAEGHLYGSNFRTDANGCKWCTLCGNYKGHVNG